jgi:hypothetical protein
MPGRLTIVSLLVLLMAAPFSAGASQKFAGRWKRTTFRVKVTVKSWGDDCGHEPKSYGNNKPVDVDVVAKGNHLVFSKGNLRTDRCVSPNPRLSTISQSNVSGNWSRVCQTPKNDPKFERQETTLKAQGNNKLVFRGKTKFEWTLKGDHCVAFLDEKRVYVREGEEKGEPAPPGKAQPEPVPGCEEHGPLKRLSINPKKEVIGPGERVCFKAQGVDANGCRFAVNASWTATQDQQEVGGLLSRGGCFSAGATAAESEGTYEITARSEGKSATAAVTVSFPDLGDLLAARLTPTEDVGGGEPGDAGPGTGAEKPAPGQEKPAAAPTPTQPAASKAAGDNTMLLIIVVAVGMVVAVALLVLAVMLRRRSQPKLDDTDDDWIDEPLPEPSRRRAQPRAVSAPADPATKPTRPLREPSQAPDSGSICPTCGEVLPTGSRFCPHDGSSLIPAPAIGSASRPGADAGMICPKCHRGYDAGASFCPHDSEKLEPYADWRDRRRNRGH